MALNEKQQKFVDAFCECLDANVAEAEAYSRSKEIAGYSVNSARSDIMNDEMIQEIQKYYNHKMVFKLAKANNEMDGILETPDQPGAAVLLGAVNSILDRGGVIKKESKEITVKSPTGVVIMPTKGELDPEA